MQETTEAIVVVGPFLWKCVNCDILMSRQHSIDYHLNSFHHSKLHPNFVLDLKDTEINCKVSLCGCQKLLQMSKGKRKNPSPTLYQPSKMKKIPDQENNCDSDKDRKEEGKIMNISEEPTISDVECGRDSCSENVTGKMQEQCSVKSCDKSLIDAPIKEQNLFNPLTDFSSTNAETEEGNSYLVHTFSPLRVKNCLPDIKLKDNSSSVLNCDDGIDADSDELIRRKSRRSNKGKNSLYTEYEMSSS